MLKSCLQGAKINLVLALALYLFALCLRLDGISTSPLQTDEPTWLSRSAKVLAMLESQTDAKTTWANRARATSHLGHPGIPPTLVMTFAEWWRKKSGSSLSELDAARIAVASCSALAVPVLFLFCSRLIGFWAALLAAILLALDPRHIAYSRMAHLDTILSVCVTVCVGLYVLAVQRGSIMLKLAAGIFWGLSLATKPTAVSLIASFLLYKLLRTKLLAKQPNGEHGYLAWSDFGAVLIGHVTFALLYTRLWHPHSGWISDVSVVSPVSRYLWRSGHFLNERLWLLALLVSTLILLGGLLIRTGFKGWQSHLAKASILIGLLVAGLGIFPQIYENFARYWLWTLGLSKTAHVGFAHKIIEPTHGYLTLLCSELPSLAVIGLCLALVLLMLRCRKGSSEREITLLLLAIICFVWIALLEISPKQTWRYALPIVPCLYALIGWGFCALAEGTLPGRRVPAFAALIVVFQCFVTLSWRPHQLVFINSISGGLKGAFAREQGLPLIGQAEAAKFLLEQVGAGNDIYITSFGETKSFGHYAKQISPKLSKHLKFGAFRRYSSDYFLAFSSHTHLTPSSWQDIEETKPVFSFDLRGVSFLRIFETPVFSFTEPTALDPIEFHPEKIRVIISEETEKGALLVEPDKDSRGLIFFNQGVRLNPGSYVMRAAVRVKHAESGIASDQTTTTPLLRLELSGCQKQFTLADANSENELALSCSFVDRRRIIPRVYWNGKVAVELQQITLQKVM